MLSRHSGTFCLCRYNCQRLILVGDPNQLPATVFSDHAMRHNYEQSLFQRMQRAGKVRGALNAPSAQQLFPQVPWVTARLRMQ